MKAVTIQAVKARRAANTVQKFLLICGILSSFWYIAINVITPLKFPGYSVVSQTVSELSAIDAPSRSLWVLLCTFYSLMIIAFGCGVWLSANDNWKLKTAGALMLVYGISGFFWPPMHLREVLAAGGGTMTDTMHIAFAVGTIILMMLMIGFGTAGLGKGFRLYSILTFFVFIVFGILTSIESPGISTNGPTPLIGVWERVNIGMFLVWVIVFSTVLIRRERSVNMD